MFDNVNMLSVNQLNARIKIQEIWKTQNVQGYPIEIAKQTVTEDRTNTRANHEGRLIEVGKKAITQKTMISDAIKLWNKAPVELKNCTNIYQLKAHTRGYVKTLPF